MRKLLTLSALTATAFCGQAQITINQASFAGWQPGIDTFQPVSQISISPSANATWDLSTGTYSTGYEVFRAPISTPAFPQATYAIDGFYSFSALQYNTELCEGITPTGRLQFGERMVRQALPIGTLTGSVNDSVVFLAQTVTYSSPRNQIIFPATMGSNWGSNYQYSTNFELSVAAFGLNSVPGYRRSHAIMKDSVKGWGKMRVKDLNGNTSAYINVLAVKRMLTVSDSFYLAGSPAPPTLLNAFGLTQGQIDSRFNIYYYRAGEVEPLYAERYSDATFSTLTVSSTHANRLPSSTTSVGEISNENSITMYPNPVISGTLQIILGDNAQTHQWSYELVNVSGQKIAANSLQPTSGKATIHLEAKGIGMHYLSIYKDGIKQATKQIVVQ